MNISVFCDTCNECLAHVNSFLVLLFHGNRGARYQSVPWLPDAIQFTYAILIPFCFAFYSVHIYLHNLFHCWLATNKADIHGIHCCTPSPVFKPPLAFLLLYSPSCLCAVMHPFRFEKKKTRFFAVFIWYGWMMHLVGRLVGRSVDTCIWFCKSKTYVSLMYLQLSLLCAPIHRMYLCIWIWYALFFDIFHQLRRPRRRHCRNCSVGFIWCVISIR